MEQEPDNYEYKFREAVIAIRSFIYKGEQALNKDILLFANHLKNPEILLYQAIDNNMDILNKGIKGRLDDIVYLLNLGKNANDQFDTEQLIGKLKERDGELELRRTKPAVRVSRDEIVGLMGSESMKDVFGRTKRDKQ